MRRHLLRVRLRVTSNLGLGIGLGFGLGLGLEAVRRHLVLDNAPDGAVAATGLAVPDGRLPRVVCDAHELLT